MDEHELGKKVVSLLEGALTDFPPDVIKRLGLARALALEIAEKKRVAQT